MLCSLCFFKENNHIDFNYSLLDNQIRERLPNRTATLTLTLAILQVNGSVLLVSIRYGSLPQMSAVMKYNFFSQSGLCFTLWCCLVGGMAVFGAEHSASSMRGPVKAVSH